MWAPLANPVTEFIRPFVVQGIARLSRSTDWSGRLPMSPDRAFCVPPSEIFPGKKPQKKVEGTPCHLLPKPSPSPYGPLPFRKLFREKSCRKREGVPPTIPLPGIEGGPHDTPLRLLSFLSNSDHPRFAAF